MDKYIMILKNKEKMILSKKQKDAVFKAIENGKTYAIIGEEMISLQIVPTILKFERWYTQENQRLANFNKRLCKFCFGVMDVITGCTCWEKNGGQKQDAIEGVKLPNSILDKFGEFPKLEDSNSTNLEAKENFLMIEENDDGVDYWLDSNGEKQYS